MKQSGLKELFGGVALIIILGIIGFMYRYEVEQPKAKLSAGSSVTSAQACTQEAKVCPDGTAVGRTGSNCAFAVCAPPNVELTSASTTLGFVLPQGYKRNIITSDDSTYIASYIQAASGSIIDIYSYPLKSGQTAEQVMLTHSVFDPSGLQATSTSEFKTVAFGQNTFYEILISRFEGQVKSSYFLYEPSVVLRFDITEKGIKNWTDPKLNPNLLSQHAALQQMLATLQII